MDPDHNQNLIGYLTHPTSPKNYQNSLKLFESSYWRQTHRGQKRNFFGGGTINYFFLNFNLTRVQLNV